MVGDWIYNWDDRSELQKLKREYLPLIRAAKAAKNTDEALQQQQNLYDRTRFIEDTAAARTSEKLASKARRWGIIPPTKSENSDEWEQSSHTGDWILVPEAEQRLRREIKEQMRLSFDEFQKWITLLIALLALLTSLGLLSVNIFLLPRTDTLYRLQKRVSNLLTGQRL